MNPVTPQTQQPTVVKYLQRERRGIESTTHHRHAIGYIMSGRRNIYRGDQHKEIRKGDAYYLGIGKHYIEDIPEGGRPFEQIVFYYDNYQINRILNQLSLSYRIEIQNDHHCPGCDDSSAVCYPAWESLSHFFESVDRYLSGEVFGRDLAAESLKMTELAYLIVAHESCCLKKCLLENADTSLVDFEQTVYAHVFNDLKIEELAKLCNRSQTAFKRQFKLHFNDSPHKWCMRQRLMHARLLLVSTNKSVARIARESSLPNTSHFIKLFKKEYGMTPVAYRKAHEKVTV